MKHGGRHVIVLIATEGKRSYRIEDPGQQFLWRDAKPVIADLYHSLEAKRVVSQVESIGYPVGAEKNRISRRQVDDDHIVLSVFK